MNRRSFLFRTGATIATSMLGLLGWSTGVEPRRVQVERRQVEIPGLPRHLHGYKIGLLTDTHLGETTPDETVRHAFALVKAEGPDLILLGGDLLSSLAGLPLLKQLVAGLNAYGVYGNWDWEFRALAALPGLRMLINEGVEVAPGLWLAGLDDFHLGDPQMAPALAGAPEGAVRLLLVHEPDWADLVRAEDRIALQLSGHAHGGQVRLPGIGPLLLPPDGRKYPMGLQSAPHTRVYTSRGVGVAHLPIRLLCPPEVTIITLAG
ncbi:MAG TPA: metallophosphoesterase [Symbiobacteriaceae bacterium]|nr:metallophosphoesterase [Symbiobacteriaceae bacterium]